MSSTRPSLSVVIVTLNEETRIRDCLESVKWADEIVVFDSLSQDRTVDICREYTSKIWQREYQGGGPMRNLAIAETTGDWIFTIDADERVTPELRAEIERTLVAPTTVAYDVPRKSYFLGKWIKHCGWWPDYVLRLFRKDRGRYDDRLAHAKVLADGPIGRLENPLLHYSYENLSDYIAKVNHRTSLMAQGDSKPTSVLMGCLHMIGRFFASYFLQGGFLDGKEGLVLSVLAAHYVFLKHMKAWEAGRRKT
jgi:glycosyltransferase involved in cell wall biosynthesis